MPTDDKPEQPPIRGKVAAIVSNRAIAINRGPEDGVRIGTRFAVLYPASAEPVIRDPDTGEELGEVGLPKVVVKVFKLSGPRLCVARTYRSIPPKRGKPGSAFAASAYIEQMISGTPGVPEQFETLSVDDQHRIDQQIKPEDSFVEVGDLVVEVRGDEFDGYSDFR